MRARSRLLLAAITSCLTLFSLQAVAALNINLPPPATETAREIYDIHMMTLRITTALMLLVMVIVIYSVWKFRRDKGYVPDTQFHRTRFGTWSWVIVPALVLGVDLTIAGHAHKVLEKIWIVPKGDMMEVKITGHQWYWEYEYPDQGVKFDSRFLPKEQAGDRYLRAVDNPLVLPTHTRIRFLHTSADVLHSFWVPQLGFRKDAIPGYVTETWTTIEKEGTFTGQCAILCGTWHSRMPIVVRAVSPEKFREWIKQKAAAQKAALKGMDPNRVWSHAELMARGQKDYLNLCAGCHQPNGEGMPPTFPALKGSKIASGPLSGHIKRVLTGVPGTAMPSWAHLNDVQIAGIITYERNAFNHLGDTVQPLQVKAER